MRTVFYITGKSFGLVCDIKSTPCGTRTRAKWKFVAKATALGVRVLQAELFVKSQESPSDLSAI